MPVMHPPECVLRLDNLPNVVESKGETHSVFMTLRDTARIFSATASEIRRWSNHYGLPIIQVGNAKREARLYVEIVELKDWIHNRSIPIGESTANLTTIGNGLDAPRAFRDPPPCVLLLDNLPQLVESKGVVYPAFMTVRDAARLFVVPRSELRRWSATYKLPILRIGDSSNGGRFYVEIAMFNDWLRDNSFPHPKLVSNDEITGEDLDSQL